MIWKSRQRLWGHRLLSGEKGITAASSPSVIQNVISTLRQRLRVQTLAIKKICFSTNFSVLPRSFHRTLRSSSWISSKFLSATLLPIILFNPVHTTQKDQSGLISQFEHALVCSEKDSLYSSYFWNYFCELFPSPSGCWIGFDKDDFRLLQSRSSHKCQNYHYKSLSEGKWIEMKKGRAFSIWTWFERVPTWCTHRWVSSKEIVAKISVVSTIKCRAQRLPDANRFQMIPSGWSSAWRGWTSRTSGAFGPPVESWPARPEAWWWKKIKTRVPATIFSAGSKYLRLLPHFKKDATHS